MSPFDDAPEFIDLDNRQKREANPVSAEQMHKKHEVLFPESLVKGKSVLDLGCCLGATGHWCLSKGAANYTGVELQGSYAQKAQELLQKYHPGKFSIHQAPIEDWLSKNTEQFDIVSILGVLYVFIDYYSILRDMAACAKETLLIEGLYHNRLRLGVDFCGVQFRSRQQINLADEDAALYGRGTRISPRGLEWLLEGLSFRLDGMLYPEPIIGSRDIYNAPLQSSEGVRYLMKFSRTDAVVPSLSEDLGGKKTGDRKLWQIGRQ